MTGYTSELPSATCIVVYDQALRRLCSCRQPDDPVSAIGHFLWPQRDHGTSPPAPLRTVSSYVTFHRELKTFLFNISFPDN